MTAWRGRIAVMHRSNRVTDKTGGDDT